MSNCGQILVLETTRANGVYLYTHSCGGNLPKDLQSALKRARDGHRLDDGPYLARIIFCEMVRGEEMGTTGYGISSMSQEEDDEQRLTVDVVDETVTWANRNGDLKTVSMREYIDIVFNDSDYAWSVLRAM